MIAVIGFMRTRLSRIPGALLCVGLVVTGCSGFDLEDVIGATSGGSGRVLDEETVIAGLREALRIGSERSIDRTAAVDGFLANELIRIVVPEELEGAASAMRRLGLGDRVDQFEVGMNRAAELAAGEARDVLWSAIRGLTFRDAMGILRGGDTAATDYFYARTADDLRQRFHPIIDEKMGEVGLARLYDRFVVYYNNLPLVEDLELDLDDYVTEEALDGLFHVLGEEERRIREDPVARTTELLRRVFAS